MAMTSYMTLEGNNQGKIDGDCSQGGREDMILLYAIDHEIEIPKDTHTGMPTGQRIHHPLKVTKHFDKATPKLYQACCSGEQFKTVEIQYYRINEKGQEEHYFTTKLEGAILVSTRAYKPMTFLEENKPYQDMEVLQFTYSKIIWTYEPDGIESEDDWKAPKA
ncbi:type VI secretion system secreted protein Hcp [Desulfosalsimonas propionicica]|uniref:Type VI secretion system secreted protein Hcp n=1 Tax=Desulfosalsimonas propionicica TaxID=332175 RepID=A0A7W0C6X3_9BACT|nr:Hcp family type VI secretion system effector [Desulfosalsimonas propionicica]MBA2880268.1 type VI secretion system secreted protein Hcp [Desulfosalsimonas propionicica]